MRGSTVFQEVFGTRGSTLMNFGKDGLNWEDNVRMKLEDLEPIEPRVPAMRKKRTQVPSNGKKLGLKYEQGHWSKKNPKNSVEVGGSGESIGFGVVTDANLGEKIRKKLSIDRKRLSGGQHLTMKLLNAINHSRLVDCRKDPRKADDVKYISLEDGPKLNSTVDARYLGDGGGRKDAWYEIDRIVGSNSTSESSEDCARRPVGSIPVSSTYQSVSRSVDIVTTSRNDQSRSKGSKISGPPKIRPQIDDPRLLKSAVKNGVSNLEFSDFLDNINSRDPVQAAVTAKNQEMRLYMSKKKAELVQGLGNLTRGLNFSVLGSPSPKNPCTSDPEFHKLRLLGLSFLKDLITEQNPKPSFPQNQHQSDLTKKILLSTPNTPNKHTEILPINSAKNPNKHTEILPVNSAKNPNKQRRILPVNSAKNPNNAREILPVKDIIVGKIMESKLRVKEIDI